MGPEGSGVLPLAIAYAQYILCGNSYKENSGGDEACNLKFDHFAHPDLHFIYPTVTHRRSKIKTKKPRLLKDWRQFLLEQLMVVCLIGIHY